MATFAHLCFITTFFMAQICFCFMFNLNYKSPNVRSLLLFQVRFPSNFTASLKLKAGKESPCFLLLWQQTISVFTLAMSSSESRGLKEQRHGGNGVEGEKIAEFASRDLQGNKKTIILIYRRSDY